MVYKFQTLLEVYCEIEDDWAQVGVIRRRVCHILR
jgi:hypothetical protein